MPLDEADLKKIADLIKAAVDPAIAKISEDVPKVVAEQLKPVSAKLTDAETIAKAAKEAAEKAGKTPADDAGKRKPDDKATDPATAKLQEQLETLQANLKAAEEEKKANAEKEKANALLAAARDALGLAGVPPERMKVALAALKDEGILAYDGETAGFKYQRKGYSEVVAGKAGAEEWLKTDAGKLFLPPSDATGTGQRGGRAPNAGGGGAQPTDAVQLTRNLFGRHFNG